MVNNSSRKKRAKGGGEKKKRVDDRDLATRMRRGARTERRERNQTS